MSSSFQEDKVGLLIVATTLAANPDYLIFDCRAHLLDKHKGRLEFQLAHIPNAQYADLEADLSSAPGAGGRHPLPSKTTLVERLRNWGVSNNSHIVCYDQNNGAFAARMWWLLRWLGHENVAVLDGGLDAWQAAGYSTTTEEIQCKPGNFTATDSLTQVCEAADLLEASNTLLDARDAARFRGEVEPIDPVAGHIPGAICIPFTGNLAEGRFKTAHLLRRRFEDLGVSDRPNNVCYCGSGVTAAHNILALLIAGYQEPALYPGSWSEWVTDPERPIETG